MHLVVEAYHAEGQMAAYHWKSEGKRTGRGLRAGIPDDWGSEAEVAWGWRSVESVESVVAAGPLQGPAWSHLRHRRRRVCQRNLRVLCVHGEGQAVHQEV